MQPDDLDFVATMLADIEVMRYYERTFTRADAQGWLDRQRQRYTEDGHGLWRVSAWPPDRWCRSTATSTSCTE
jgi:hypothetical protein